MGGDCIYAYIFAYFTVCTFFSIQVFGVKGPSQLTIVPKFDLVRGVAMDYMHCALLGATRLLLRLWFNHRESWYIGTRVVEVDDKLCAIRPPDEIPRTPRSIQKTLKYWKGIIILFFCSS